MSIRKILNGEGGPIRYRDDARKQASMRPFEHYIIPRFTSLRVPLDKDEKTFPCFWLCQYHGKGRFSNMQAGFIDFLMEKMKCKPVEDFQSKDITALRETLELLETAGISLIYKTNIHQKFAVVYVGFSDELLEEIIEDTELSPSEKRTIFESLIKEASHRRYDGWTDWRLNYLQSASILKLQKNDRLNEAWIIQRVHFCKRPVSLV